MIRRRYQDSSSVLSSHLFALSEIWLPGLGRTFRADRDDPSGTGGRGKVDQRREVQSRSLGVPGAAGTGSPRTLCVLRYDRWWTRRRVACRSRFHVARLYFDARAVMVLYELRHQLSALSIGFYRDAACSRGTDCPRGASHRQPCFARQCLALGHCFPCRHCATAQNQFSYYPSHGRVVYALAQWKQRIPAFALTGVFSAWLIIIGLSGI